MSNRTSPPRSRGGRHVGGASVRGFRLQPKNPAEHLELVRYQQRARRRLLLPMITDPDAARSLAHRRLNEPASRDRSPVIDASIDAVFNNDKLLREFARRAALGAIEKLAASFKDRRGFVFGRLGRRPTARSRHPAQIMRLR